MPRTHIQQYQTYTKCPRCAYTMKEQKDKKLCDRLMKYHMKNKHNIEEKDLHNAETMVLIDLPTSKVKKIIYDYKV